MSPRISKLLTLLIVAGNLAALVLYSGEGPIDPAIRSLGDAWNPALRFIADLTTLPISTSGIADVRDVILPIVFSLGLLLAAGCIASTVPLRPAPSRRASAPIVWIAGCAAAVALIAIVSASVNQSVALSTGWIIRFACGAGWAMLLAAAFAPEKVVQATRLLFLVGVVVLLLAIAHRADRGLAGFVWPIGPITITGAVAAALAALAAGHLVAVVRWGGHRIDTVAALLGAFVAIQVVQGAGRRASGLGFLVALLAAAVVATASRYKARAARLALAAVVIFGVGSAAFYVFRQASSNERTIAGPLTLRFAYWRQCANMILDHPLLGIGPDLFVVEATSRLAPLRAVSPHVYHGNIDPAAHNEWLQAAVELGLPAAILYMAMPIGVLLMALRRRSPSGAACSSPTSRSTGQRSPAATAIIHTKMALAAGIICIGVTECASIALRGPIMPMLYWTLLGLLAALCRDSIEAPQPARRRISPRIAAALLIGAAVIPVRASIDELVSAVEPAHAEPGVIMIPHPRLFAEKTLADQWQAAWMASQAATEEPSRDHVDAAASMWTDLHRLLPSYLDVAAGYAQALLAADRAEEARGVLLESIEPTRDPYNVAANTLLAALSSADPVAQVCCVRRALRAGALSDPMRAILDGAAGHPEASRYVADRIEGVRQVCAAADDAQIRKDEIELLRIAAYLQEKSGDLRGAIADQHLAAAAYRRLERSGSLYRRASDAEWDAFYQLARMLYAADPANYPEAFAAILEAERYAVLGIRHEQNARPDPSLGFVGGEVVPTEFPERLRPMWRLSALLHLVAGRGELLEQRIMSSLPPEQWYEEVRTATKRALLRQALDDLERVPPDRRPAWFETFQGQESNLNGSP